jgi:integrase
MRIKLTAPFVDNPPIPSKGSVVYWDTDPIGFGLSVTANGAKAFVFNYRHHGKLRRMHMKPGLTLAKARQQARVLQGQVAAGADPLSERRKEEAADENTLRAISDEYFRLEGHELRTRKDREQYLAKHILPTLGKRQIDDIERLEITRLIERIRDESGPSAAKHAFAYLRALMNWYATRSNTFKSPIVPGMAKRIKTPMRQRSLADDELRAVWAASGDDSLFSKYVRFLLLTACRRCDASKMRRSELSGADWVIPESRYKTGMSLLVPLSAAALEVLNSVPRFAKSDLVFTVSGKYPLADFSFRKKAFDQHCGVTGWTLHDLRRTARSLMSRAGIDPDTAERCLGHSIGGIRGVYDVYAYGDEKRRAFEALASMVEKITNPPAGNVHQLRRGA